MGKLRKSIAGSSYVRANSLGTHIITMNNSFCPSARDLHKAIDLLYWKLYWRE